MKKKAIALAGCMAFAAPSISIAQAFPANLVGMNLGEIQASSYLNQPFRGVIPFLFTSIESSSQFKVRLAHESIFAQIGAEKLPILDDLNFQVTVQANKPVILISSNRPIQLPFLNFVLEVEGPGGVVYQDYTVLLDPPNYQENSTQTNKADKQFQQAESVAIDNLMRATFASTNVSSSKPLKHRVKSGDSLSKIAQQQKQNGVSTKMLAQGIFKKNPNAFIRGDINKIKKGALLILPTLKELNGFELAQSESKTPKQATKKVKETYKVSSGDSLSIITKKFAAKDVSFTKMMNAIYTSNPEAFSKNSKNLLKTGAVLQIPAVEDVLGIKQQDTLVTTVAKTDKQAPITPEKLSVSTSNTQDNASINEIEITSELSDGEYRIKEGDTLAQVTKEIGYEDASFTKMMKAIYIENPEAFEKNNITKLIPGVVIHLPKLSDVEQTPQKNITAQMVKTDSVDIDENTQKENPVAASILEKRIRSLRAELDQAKSGLSDLQKSLDTKDSLIVEKDGQLINLKSTLNKLKLNQTTINKVSKIAEPVTLDELTIDKLYKGGAKSTAEKATLALSKTGSENIDIGFNDKLRNYVTSNIESSSIKYLAYMSLALLLGLILIRYRREIYSYTRINFDQPNYYPTPSSDDKYKLSEKNICYQDTLDDSKQYETENVLEQLTQNNKPDRSRKKYKSYEEVGFFRDDEIEEYDDIEESDEIEKSDEIENSDEIKHCEHLVTELFDELNNRYEADAVSDKWDSIEKVCDNYIHEIKEEQSSLRHTDKPTGGGAIADFEVMMNDLIQNLNEVEGSINNRADTSELVDDDASTDDELVEDTLINSESHKTTV